MRLRVEKIRRERLRLHDVLFRKFQHVRNRKVILGNGCQLLYPIVYGDVFHRRPLVCAESAAIRHIIARAAPDGEKTPSAGRAIMEATWILSKLRRWRRLSRCSGNPPRSWASIC